MGEEEKQKLLGQDQKEMLIRINNKTDKIENDLHLLALDLHIHRETIKNLHMIRTFINAVIAALLIYIVGYLINRYPL